MGLKIHDQLNDQLAHPTDVLLQLEAAAIPEHVIGEAHIVTIRGEHFARVDAHDQIGDRLWLRIQRQLIVNYTATVSIERLLTNYVYLPKVPRISSSARSSNICWPRAIARRPSFNALSMPSSARSRSACE